MPSIFEELKTYLKTKSGITGLVGTGDNAKIYEKYAKQNNDPPYIVVQVFAGSSAEHLGGISGLATNRIQIDAYGLNSSDALALAEQIRLPGTNSAGLQMFRGTMGSTFVNEITSSGGYDTGSDPLLKGGTDRRFWVSRDYMFTYQEQTTT